jgi:Flp pilus assembly protein TadG
MKPAWKSEQGAVMVVAALLLTSLFGVTALAVDAGMVYVTRVQLQKAADAAALAGARTLRMTGGQSEAETIATQYVSANYSLPCRQSFVSEPAIRRFTVNLQREVQFYFAPLIGYTKTTVSVRAVAVVWGVSRLQNVVPFGVLEQQFIYGQQYILKYGANSEAIDANGDYGALALGGFGSDVYLVNLKFGYSGAITVGEKLTTEPGNMAGSTEEGVGYRIDLCTDGCSYENGIKPNCPRIVLVPLVDALPDGRGYTIVKGFAAFFLEDVRESDSPGQIDVVGRFMQYAVTAEADAASPDYGVYTIKLIE